MSDKDKTKDREEKVVSSSENLEEEMKDETLEDSDVVKETVNIQEYDALKIDYEKLKNTYQRLLADFENNKRRTAQEMLLEKLRGKEEVLAQMLDIVDNFERAAQFDSNTEEFKKGIEMVHGMFEERLKVVGLKEVETQGILNPDIHVAVAVDNDADMQDDQIIETLQKGYYIEDRLIRPAMVKVNKKNN